MVAGEVILPRTGRRHGVRQRIPALRGRRPIPTRSVSEVFVLEKKRVRLEGFGAISSHCNRGAFSLDPKRSNTYVFLPFTAVSLTHYARNLPVKTPYFAVALAVAALTLAPASNPCQAGQLTYDFVEGSTAPNPGEIGATITLESPAASPTTTWIISALSDIVLIHVIDSSLFTDGFSGAFPLGAIGSPLSSADGQALSVGIIDSVPTNSLVNIVIEPTHTLFEIGGGPSGTNTVPGTWLVAAASVPEPASAVQAGIAIATGLALAAFRKRKEARRRRPVGPLDANQ
jgi:hypothetical protein